jgi:5-methylcytosine-specific restriction enzyme subunit McrC
VSAAAVAQDLSPFAGDLTVEDERWLARLAELDPRDFRVGVDDERAEDEVPRIVDRAPDGCWWAGRYIGSITLDGRQLVIEPRLGVSVIERWLDQAFGLVAPPASARQVASETFIVRLLARLWCRSVDDATRHGLPLLRVAARHEGLYVRGALDVGRTITLLGEGRESVASISHDRSLQHPTTRAIVCAERVLGDRLSASGEWRTPRVRQVAPALRAAVGSRPRLPSLHQLSRVRYTPITLAFRRAALLSHRIASRLGYSASESTGNAEGILIDVAELWELFLLNCARPVVPLGVRIEHGTRHDRKNHLLQSSDGRRHLGRLKPDLVVLDDDRVLMIIDAKYKRLAATRMRPTGVDQADLYQLAAYAARFNPGIAALAYPCAPDDSDRPQPDAEAYGPWLSGEQTYMFLRLPTDADACRTALGALLPTPPINPEPA